MLLIDKRGRRTPSAPVLGTPIALYIDRTKGKLRALPVGGLGFFMRVKDIFRIPLALAARARLFFCAAGRDPPDADKGLSEGEVRGRCLRRAHPVTVAFDTFRDGRDDESTA